MHNQLSDNSVNKEECYRRHLFHKKNNLEENNIQDLEKEFEKYIENCEIPQSTASDIIKLFQTKKTVSDLYYDLLHISSKHAAVEHILNRFKNQDNLDKNKKNSFQILKQFIDTCLDLRSALTALAWQQNDCPAKKLVLLIDDQPHYVKDDIEDIFKTFLPNIGLVVWNSQPLSEQNALHLSYYCL